MGREETAISRLMAHQSEPPPSIRKTRPDLPRALETAYLAMMGERPEDCRPQSMADVIARLDSCRSSSSGSVYLSLHSFSSTAVEMRSRHSGIELFLEPLVSLHRHAVACLVLGVPTMAENVRHSNLVDYQE